jgi:hypothetical protein
MLLLPTRYKDTFFVDTCNDWDQSFVFAAYNAHMILGKIIAQFKRTNMAIFT